MLTRLIIWNILFRRKEYFYLKVLHLEEIKLLVVEATSYKIERNRMDCVNIIK
jgi:hypothetical protein